jgi:IS66 C-terminal element
VDIQANVGVELRHQSVLLRWAHELRQPFRRWSQLDVRADQPSAEHDHATNLFVGSESGGKSAAIACTLIKSAKLDGVEPQAWLTDVLSWIADHRITRIDELPPWRYAAATA